MIGPGSPRLLGELDLAVGQEIEHQRRAAGGRRVMGRAGLDGCVAGRRDCLEGLALGREQAVEAGRQLLVDRLAGDRVDDRPISAIWLRTAVRPCLYR